MDRRENDRRYRSRAEMLRDRRRRRKRTCLIELLIVLFFIIVVYLYGKNMVHRR